MRPFALLIREAANPIDVAELMIVVCADEVKAAAAARIELEAQPRYESIELMDGPGHWLEITHAPAGESDASERMVTGSVL